MTVIRATALATVLAALLSGVLAAGAPAAVPVKFKQPRTSTVGFDPLSLAVADLNADGNRDIATANFAASPDPAAEPSISVLKGSRKGRFKAAGTLPAPSQPDGIAIGRLAGDKDPDIVVGGFTGFGEVTVFRGAAGLGFSPPESYPIGGGPRQTAIADFNRDGIADIATKRQDTNDIAVMRGLGAGSFTAPVLLSAGPGGFLGDIVVARLNGDRLPDLAATRDDGKVLAYLAKPDGSFRAPKVTGVGRIPLALAAADFNRDGTQDLVVTIAVTDDDQNVPLASGLLSTEDRVTVLTGKGNGSFKRAFSRKVGGGGGVLKDVAVADFNRDRRKDVAVSMELTGQVAVLRSAKKRARLGRPTFVRAGERPQALVAARLDRGKSPDIAVSGVPKSGPGKVTVLLQKQKRKRRR